MTHHTRNHTEKSVLARVQRRGTRHQQSFRLNEYGSWEKAEKAAQKWVNRMLRTLPAPISSKDRMTARNRSGVVGVHLRSESIRKANGKRYEYNFWVARWPECRLKAGVKWAVHNFGDDDAFVLAVLCRYMENEDREQVIAEFMRTVAGKRYRQLLTLRGKKGPPREKKRSGKNSKANRGNS